MSAPVTDRFAELAWRPGPQSSVPLLNDCIVQAEVARTASIEVGDHIGFFGELLSCTPGVGRPLLFFQGRLCTRHGQQ